MTGSEIVALLKERLRYCEQGSTNAVEFSYEEAKALLDSLQPSLDTVVAALRCKGFSDAEIRRLLPLLVHEENPQ